MLLEKYQFNDAVPVVADPEEDGVMLLQMRMEDGVMLLEEDVGCCHRLVC